MHGLNLFSQLHDATLRTLRIDWEQGGVHLELRAVVAGSSEPSRVTVNARETSLVHVPRQAPWGPSNAINELRCFRIPSGAIRLEVEMQSGDVVAIEAGDVAAEVG